jgi:hypothetical protein
MPTPPEPADDPAADPRDDAEGQGGATAPEPRRPASERTGSAPRASRRPRKAEKATGRKLVLSDRVFNRLQLQAIKKGMTASAVAEEVLDRNLPRLRIEQEG